MNGAKELKEIFWEGASPYYKGENNPNCYMEYVEKEILGNGTRNIIFCSPRRMGSSWLMMYIALRLSLDLKRVLYIAPTRNTKRTFGTFVRATCLRNAKWFPMDHCCANHFIHAYPTNSPCVDGHMKSRGPSEFLRTQHGYLDLDYSSHEDDGENDGSSSTGEESSEDEDAVKWEYDPVEGDFSAYDTIIMENFGYYSAHLLNNLPMSKVIATTSSRFYPAGFSTPREGRLVKYSDLSN